MSKLSRRDFLAKVAAIGSGAVAAPVFGASPTAVEGSALEKKPAPNDRLNIAVIGTGNQGRSNVKALLSLGQNIVALCDVDQNQIAVAKQENAGANGATVYDDYRKLLEREKSLDAVVIATPDHWHAPLCKAAMQAGKHVYCEKPLTRTIGEARELRELAKASRVVTQMGNHGSASASMRRSLELIKAGVLGQVHEVHAYVPGGHFKRGIARPAGEDAVPAQLNWDFWVGPSPLRPYKQGLYHPRTWRGWYDFGSGQLGDFGCHAFNLPMRALDLDYPQRIEISGTGMKQDSYFIGGTIKLHFAARGALGPVTLIWYDNIKPPEELFKDVLAVYHDQLRGVLLIGEQGILFTNPWNMAALIKLKGDDRLQDVLHHEATKDIAVTLPRVRSHQGEWVQACLGGAPTFSDFEIGGHLTEIVLSGVLAARLGHDVEWNGEKMETATDAEARNLIHPQYRKDWLM